MKFLFFYVVLANSLYLDIIQELYFQSLEISSILSQGMHLHNELQELRKMSENLLKMSDMDLEQFNQEEVLDVLNTFSEKLDKYV